MIHKQSYAVFLCLFIGLGYDTKKTRIKTAYLPIGKLYKHASMPHVFLRGLLL